MLVSSLFYFRIPRERWRDRIQLLKAAGYHAIDVYFPWNYHQISPDEWCFEENRDVEYFLKLAAENELYVIARPALISVRNGTEEEYRHGCGRRKWR